jgi:alpha-tubulin suppressor-like RCC1 family protein
VQIGAQTDWSKISGTSDTALAIKTTGSLWAWGTNNSGQLGQNNVIYRSSPVQIGAQTDWAQVGVGGQFCIAIKTTGTMWSWGQNDVGQLGQNTASVGTYRSSPVQIGAQTDWSKIALGNAHALAIKTTGTMWSWGENNAGQLGQNTLGGTANTSSPVQIGADTNWAQVNARQNTSAALETAPLINPA